MSIGPTRGMVGVFDRRPKAGLASPDCPRCGRATLEMLGHFHCSSRKCRREAREAREEREKAR